MITRQEILAAKKKIQSLTKRTPLVECPELQAILGGGSFYLKLETTQETGSFKLRGAANKLLSLSQEERKKGVVAVSTGNHGRAVAHAAKKLDIPASVCISKKVPENKVRAIAKTGASLEIVGDSYDQAFEHAQNLVKTQKMTLVAPFDDPHVIAGQGTIGLEILEDLPDVDIALVPLSGGGLINGIAVALKSANPRIRIVGISMEKGAAMYQSIQAKKPVQVEELDTLADSLKGGIGLNNRYTFSLVQQYVDDLILLSEKEIKAGMAYAFQELGMVLEGAAAVTLGALLSKKVQTQEKKCVLIFSGRNVDLKDLECA